MVLVLCTSSDDGLYCIKFHENILHGIKVIERTQLLSVVVVVVLLSFYVHGKHLRSCRDGQLT